jgi:streptogramin lyase
VRIWDVNHQKEIARFERKGGMVVVFSPSGDRLATLSPTETAIDNVEGKGSDHVALDLWRLPSESVPVEPSSVDLSGIVAAQQGSPPLGIAASPDGSVWFWSGPADGFGSERRDRRRWTICGRWQRG